MDGALWTGRTDDGRGAANRRIERGTAATVHKHLYALAADLGRVGFKRLIWATCRLREVARCFSKRGPMVTKAAERSMMEFRGEIVRFKAIPRVKCCRILPHLSSLTVVNMAAAAVCRVLSFTRNAKVLVQPLRLTAVPVHRYSLEVSSTGEAVTHTGQVFDENDPRRARFVGRQKEVNKNFAIKLVAEEPVTHIESRVVSCDGGGGALGHPKVYINLHLQSYHWSLGCFSD
ncbi:NADH dehydrogenase [ubiquinone] iron-sulfur protein 6, mitochondrial isoform X2 [Girardinichthys multiradiatus]|uniref:NADH dehydrogenase [ubiquinone] iron-sulfur protein 6, mitochondrial isoform X2 n=1 Tax=Girardinichthys multiradiatus TaxID=208333 RepID=UPI001FAD216E|nr:NADH dehydrogenase [ubiquinone] iron-sulfur protein 6, mitochondrial isoform X2 [Girardinichthys multiradiatus]